MILSAQERGERYFVAHPRVADTVHQLLRFGYLQYVGVRLGQSVVSTARSRSGTPSWKRAGLQYAK